MDRRTIKQPYSPYEKINGGFEVSINDGENIITFEKEGGFTKTTFRDTIRERYKNGQIRKICRTCKNTCKQEEMRGVKFRCSIKEYEYRKRNRREKK